MLVGQTFFSIMSIGMYALSLSPAKKKKFDFIVLYSQNPWIFDRVELINDEIGLAMIMIEPKRNQNWSKSKIGGR